MKQLDSGGEYTSYINSHSIKNLDDTDLDAIDPEDEEDEDSEYQVSNHMTKKQKKRELKNQRKLLQNQTGSRVLEQTSQSQKEQVFQQ